MRNAYLQMCDYGSRFRILKGGKISLVVAAILAGTTLSFAAPTGGVVTSGSATISQSGSTTNINQSTQKASINWQNFSVGTTETVNFNQPSVSSITLNRVIGNEKSVIDGALNANGQVWILNANGVLFNANAKINTSGLLATTTSLNDDDFQAGNYSFTGDSTASVINLGEITIHNGGYASLLAKSVSNEGTIQAVKGTVTLTGASEATVNLNGNSLVSLKVDKGVLDALVENKGAIIADGGKVYLTTNAVDELLRGVVNNTGVIEAHTLDDITGEIILYAHGGTTNVGGTLDASAPTLGNGGFIETSGAEMNLMEGVRISANSKNGTSGTWLIDPYNYEIDATAATTIVSALNGGTSVTIDTASSSGTGVIGYGSGDIEVSSSIETGSMSADATLTLKAARNIIIDSGVSIDATGSSNAQALNVVFLADSDYSGDGITLMYGTSIKTNGGSITFGDGTTITLNSVSTLVGGDVYFNASTAQTLETSGGAISVNGAMMLANTNGLTVNTNGGNVTFEGLVDSGNTYTQVYNGTGISWADALSAAKSGDGDGVGDTYLATITSRLENIVAGQSIGYNESWIGGQRVYDSTSGTSYWRWVTGPEGLEKSGAGRIFYTQTNVYSGTSTGYTNWNSGEPNNNADGGGPYSLSTLSETALQFTGALGQWNDLANVSTRTLNYYVKETNLAASPLTINAGSGTVTFNKAVGSNKALDTLNVTASTIAINGGGVTTESAQTYTGNITLGSASTILTQTNADTDFTFQANKSVTNAYGSDASLTIKTTGNILMSQGVSITSSSGGLDTIFWADSDANNNGYIFIYDGNTISTNGGDIVLAGGTDTNNDNRPDGYATSATADISGVSIGRLNDAATSGTTIQSGGGNIFMKGKSTAVTGSGMGINFSHSGILSAGAGTLTMIGESSSYAGIELSAWLNSVPSNSYLDISAYSINISGTSSSAGKNGLASSQLSNKYTRMSAGAGGIYLYGHNTADSARGIDISLDASTTDGGDITLESPNKINFYNGANAHSLNAGTGDITLKSNTLALGSSNSITSSGTLTLLPYTDSTTIGVAGETGTLSLATSYFTINFTDGFEKIVIGSTTQTGNITLGALSLKDDLTLYTQGSVTQTGAITGEQDLVLLGVGGGYILTNLSNNIASLTADTGSVTYSDSNALSLGSISATGLINIATLSGDLTLTGSITTTDTTDLAIILNAGQSSVAGTTTGGNILVSGGSISTGSTGRATLYSGSVSASTGLSTLIGSGSGHFRYNSDETTTNYTATLGSGIYAVYREEPILSVTPSSVTMTYGDALPGSYTYSYAGFVNGDTTSTVGISGTVSFDVTGSANASGYYNAGTYTVSYVSGLASSLGYAFQNDASSTDQLTVNKASLSVTAASTSKTYDGTAYSSGAGVTYSGFVAGEDAGVLSGTLTYGGSSQGAIDAGTYAISASGLSSGNYTITYSDGTLIVSKANATVTVDSLSSTYNGTSQTIAGYTVSGLVNNEDASVLDTVTLSGGGTNAGTYTISGSGSDTNYNLSFTNGTLTITPASLTVTAASASKTYDGTAYSGGAGVTYNGFVAGEDAGVLSGTLTYSGDSQGAIDVGSYSILASGLATINYGITYINGVLTIYQNSQPLVTSIVNGTTLQTPTVEAIIVPKTGMADASSVQNIQTMELSSTPMSDVATELVSLQEVKKVLSIQANEEVSVLLGQNSLIQLINGGVHLPEGVEQEFFMVQR